MKIVEAVFEKTKIFNFFLMWTTLHFECKSKNNTGNICKGTPDIEFEQDWWVGLGATLRDRQEIKNYFSSFRIFSEKADSVFRMYYKPTKFNKNYSHFWQNRNINYFSCELPLIFGVEGKLKEKKGSRYLHEDPIYRIWTRSVNWFRLYVRRRSHRQTDTHAHTFFFSKTHF